MSSRRCARPPSDGERSPRAVELRVVLRGISEEWAQLIRRAAAAGHPLADVARAAGVAAPSFYYRLGRPVLGDSVRRPQRAGGDLCGVGEPAPAVGVDPTSGPEMLRVSQSKVRTGSVGGA